jgi:hypothetical protein
MKVMGSRIEPFHLSFPMEAHAEPVPHLSRGGMLACVPWKEDLAKWPKLVSYRTLPGEPWQLASLIDHSVAHQVIRSQSATTIVMRKHAQVFYALLHPCLADVVHNWMESLATWRRIASSDEAKCTVDASPGASVEVDLVRRPYKVNLKDDLY